MAAGGRQDLRAACGTDARRLARMAVCCAFVTLLLALLRFYLPLHHIAYAAAF